MPNPRAAVVFLVPCVAVLAQAPRPESVERAAGAGQDPARHGERHPDGPLRLLDAHLVLLGAAGAATERDGVLGELSAGAHDPRRRGFTFQQAELSLSGVLDPWLEGHALLVAAIDADDGETVVELEEAYVATRGLPGDLQLRAGTFLTAFGIVNRQHPHDWTWQNQPVVLSRLFGGDGMRGPGAAVAWSPADFEFVLSAQNANGETMPSFLANAEVYDERAIGGRGFAAPEVRSGGDLVWSLHVGHEAELAAGHVLGLGASASFGPNATGRDADTLLLGADLRWRWQYDARHAERFVEVQAEFLARAFDAAAQVDDSDPGNPIAVPADTLRDHGGYLQVHCGVAPAWSAGVRVEQVAGAGAGYDAATRALVPRDGDPFRADRLRVSPLLTWSPSPHARVRLQYDYDDSDHLSGSAHSVWLGFEVEFGAAGAHVHGH